MIYKKFILENFLIKGWKKCKIYSNITSISFNKFQSNQISFKFAFLFSYAIIVFKSSIYILYILVHQLNFEDLIFRKKRKWQQLDIIL